MSYLYKQILSQANIKEVVQSYGISITHGKCLCPFHADSNPSMSFFTSEQGILLAHCFPCGKTWNAISFVKDYEKEVNHNLSFSENDAEKAVIEKCKLSIDVSQLPKKEDFLTQKYSEPQRKIIQANEQLQSLFNYNLTATNKGESTRDYLFKRGIDKDAIKEFGFGITDDQNFQSEKFSVLAEQVGILDFNGNNRFLNRLMIPIRDEEGNLVAFSGRTLINDDVKYMTPSALANPVYQKSKLLYHLDRAKHNAYGKELILVEGFFDVVGAEKLGFNNAVALMGTTITEEHLELMKGLKCDITLALDNDSAGKKAMLSKIPELLDQGFTVNIIDIAKIAEGKYKDFGDIGNTDITKKEVLLAKQSAIEYVFLNKYIDTITLTSIQSAFKQMKTVGLIKNSADEQLFIEAVLNNTEKYEEYEIENVLFPVSSHHHPATLQHQLEKAFRDIFAENLDKVVQDRDQTTRKYYKEHKTETLQKCIELYYANYKIFYSPQSESVNYGELLHTALTQDKEYNEYYQTHFFPYEEIFSDVSVYNEHGSGKVILNEEQKVKIITCYNRKFADSNIPIDELHIVNSADDLKKILPIFHTETLKLEIMGQLKDNCTPTIFQYGVYLDEKTLSIYDEKLKNKDGTRLKNLLLVPNLGNHFLSLTKENFPNSMEKKALAENKKNQTQHQKQSFHSVYSGLVEKETEKKILIKVPRTNGKDYMWIPTDKCRWNATHTSLYFNLAKGKDVMITDAGGNEIRTEKYNYIQNHFSSNTWGISQYSPKKEKEMIKNE